MFATEALENGVAEACKELDMPIVAYSPLGRGFLVCDMMVNESAAIHAITM